MSKKALVVLLLIVALVSTTFTGCKTAQGPSVIKIGGIGPVTGEASTFGVSTRNGYEMMIEEWNAKGGVLGKKVELVFADDKGDPTEGATAAQKLINEDKVVAIAGTVMSKVSLAIAPICQNAGIPMVSPTSTNPKVTQVGDYIFRACFIDPFQGTVGAVFAYNNLKARKAGVLFDNSNDYTKGLAEFFRDKFTSLGGQIVAFEGHPAGTTDFTPFLTKILAGSPDVIYCPDYYSDDGLMAKQARQLGYKGPFLGGDGWDSPDLVKIGGDAVNNSYFTNHFSKDDQRPEVQEFVKKYTAKYGEAPDALAALGYDAMGLILQAIQNAGSTDGAKIRDALKNIEYHGVSGLIKFDENRNPVKPAVIIKIENGKQVYVTTVNP
ncbi:MAG: ABC transporter substrate-binding protein [Caldisericum sp.]|uniref:ABC transporter substrate-binding protein n=1 Tax=Caldisericum sp. TaxID=2499687 RepID=UPI003D0A337F